VKTKADKTQTDKSKAAQLKAESIQKKENNTGLPDNLNQGLKTFQALL